MANLPTIKRGNTYRFTWTHQHNGAPEDLTGATVIFTVKDIEGDDVLDDSSAPIQITVSDHLPQEGDTLGKTVIECLPTQTITHRTTGLPLQKTTYTFDIKVIHADGTQFTEEEGKVKVDIAPTNKVSV